MVTFKKCPPEKPYYRFDAEGGKTYLWCSCGTCKNQPFWDGPEASPHCKPVTYAPAETKDVEFCGCRRTATPPFCDGTHKRPLQ